MEQTGKNETVVNLHILRAVAAIIVVLYHFHPFQPGHPLFQFGSSGVDIFFLISGFVMVHAWKPERTSWEFWRDRVLRIHPMYWLALGILLGLAALGKFPIGLRTYTPGDFLSSLFLYAHKPSNGGNYPLLPPAWTLVYEVYFYLLFGLLLVLKSIARIIGALVVFFLACLGIWFENGNSNYIVSVYTNPILFEFLIGAILALGYQKTFTASAKTWLDQWGRLTATILIAAGIAGIFADQGHVKGALSSEGHFIYFAGPATLLVGGMLLAERAGLRFKNKWLFLLGSASYSIYLFHLLFLDYGLRELGRFLPFSGNPLIEAVNLFAGVGLAVTGGVCIHLWIERPMMKTLRRIALPPRQTVKPPVSQTSGPAPNS